MTIGPYQVKVTPDRAKESVWAYSRCIYTISIGAANRTVEEILDGYLWASSHFDTCALLLGDSLYRFTLQIQQGMDETDATLRARQLGDSTISAILARVSDSPVVTRSSDLMEEKRFAGALHDVEMAYANDESFSSAIDRDAAFFVERQKRKRRLALPLVEAQSLASKYLIEEVAVYKLLADEEWLVDVYLGDELPTLVDIMMGNIQSLAEPLSRRINISLTKP